MSSVKKVSIGFAQIRESIDNLANIVNDLLPLEKAEVALVFRIEQIKRRDDLDDNEHAREVMGDLEQVLLLIQSGYNVDYIKDKVAERALSLVYKPKDMPKDMPKNKPKNMDRMTILFHILDILKGNSLSYDRDTEIDNGMEVLSRLLTWYPGSVT